MRQRASAKKTRIEDPPAAGPSKNTTPPPSPLEQQTPPAPVESTPSPPAPVDHTQLAALVQTWDDIPSRALRSAKDRMTRILRHERSREAMVGTESMDVDHILNRTLNELASAMLTVTASQLRSGVITEQSKSSEQRHAEELKAAEEKYAEQLEEAQKENAALLEEKNKLVEEMAQNYLPECMRQTEIARCASRLEEEERAKIPASPEISLATDMEGVDNEAEVVVDQENPQDPPAS
ncbi:uncharacterized protein LOC133805666 [Humulus lupulus]|uniref:uncharacterized protein LOC133805666 n=1 Tax=Humulus lupulus TaxID=3486 RepID=UPI002B40E0EB|nr:uncharacterized protein LOC133805666 [Humulus lupulus]